MGRLACATVFALQRRLLLLLDVQLQLRDRLPDRRRGLGVAPLDHDIHGLQGLARPARTRSAATFSGYYSVFIQFTSKNC